MNSAAMLLACPGCCLVFIIMVMGIGTATASFITAGNGRFELDPLDKLIWERRFGGRRDASMWEAIESYSPAPPPVYMGRQDGLMEEDRIVELPGEPAGVNFNHYAGYVTVEPNNGRALFYYFAESPLHAAAKPLVLWLNGGPGCSSFGNGAMLELGPFRVNRDGKSLQRNVYAWNNVANVIFLESPAGVGFSYSNTTTDYGLNGDRRTAQDSYTFLVNWLERFPQYNSRDFYIAGESYAGHYVPQLAQTILQNNKITKQAVINLRGITIGNAWIDEETNVKGMYDFFWTHALMSDELHQGISLNCNFSSERPVSDACIDFLNTAGAAVGNIDIYNIYASRCNGSASSPPDGSFDPCSSDYVASYLNLPQVQKALHVVGVPQEWEACSYKVITGNWTDSPATVLPVIQGLMSSGISVWIYSGDTDGRVPVTSTRYSINRLNAKVETAWYPWYSQGEVGGYAVGYNDGLTFITVRGAGHLVPSYQPARALTFFTSFLEGKLPPSS